MRAVAIASMCVAALLIVVLLVFVALVHFLMRVLYQWWLFFCFQAEDGIRDLVRSRGLGDVYKRQICARAVSRASTVLCAVAVRLTDWVAVAAKASVAALSLIHI